MPVFESTHPLVKHKVSLLRDNDISVKSFRELAKEISMLLTVEATQNFNVKNTSMTCWSGEISVPTLADKQPTLVPILRAGLGMLEGSLLVLPCAKISVVGLQRNEETLQPESYYENIISDIESRTAIVIDPMLATGQSMALTYRSILQKGQPKTTHIVAALASAEGIEYVKKHLPVGVELWLGAVDEELTAQAYIVPGLGDAGDLAYGSKS